MTPKEAIQIIEQAKAEIEWNYPMDYEVAFDLAVKALKRQISKRPKSYNITEDCFDYQCPECHMAYGRSTWRVNFCPRCGQAFVWGDGEREEVEEVVWE